MKPKRKSTHHISHKSLSGIQFVLYRFRSPLLTISQLLSFPPPTKMFQFGGFPILHGSTHKNMSGSPIRQSWVPKMYAPRPSLSQLTTTFIGNSSQAIPQIAQVAKFYKQLQQTILLKNNLIHKKKVFLFNHQEEQKPFLNIRIVSF